MASKKYIKDKRGITRAITTPNLGLEKPLTNENYDVNVFNGNMDKVDKGIKDAKDIANSKAAANHTHNASDINGISTNAKGTSFDNSTNGMAATNVQDAIDENKTSILDLEKINGELSNLQTTNKTNLVSAINEVFQNANNGKDIIANAIGSPLVNSDTFSVMGTKIDALTQTFQNTLTEKGVEVLPSDKMSTLISKVKGIELGRKWASGDAIGYSVLKNFLGAKQGTDITRSSHYAEANFSLNFTPSFIFVYCEDDNKIFRFTVYIKQFYSFFSDIVYEIWSDGLPNSNGANYGYAYKANMADCVVNNNGFILPFVSGGKSNVKWLAIE